MKKQILITIFLSLVIMLSAINLEKIAYKQTIINQFPKSKGIIEKIFYYAELYQVDPYLCIALAFKESSFRQYAVNTRNRNGSIDRGIFQLNSYSYPNFKLSDFYNLDKNISTGIKHIRDAIKRGGSEYNGLSIYNCGRIKTKSIYADRILKTKNYFFELFDSFVKRVENSNHVFFIIFLLDGSKGAPDKSAQFFCRMEDIIFEVKI